MESESKVLTISEIAKGLQMDTSNARKYALKHGFTFIKVRCKESKNQQTLALTLEDYESLRSIREKSGFVEGPKTNKFSNKGVFYIIQPIPDLAPDRIKLGFSTDIDQRLSTYKTICHGALLIKSYPCKAVWERAAMDSITRSGCRQLSQELFEVDSLESLVKEADSFFDRMPK